MNFPSWTLLQPCSLLPLLTLPRHAKLSVLQTGSFLPWNTHWRDDKAALLSEKRVSSDLSVMLVGSFIHLIVPGTLTWMVIVSSPGFSKLRWNPCWMLLEEDGYT